MLPHRIWIVSEQKARFFSFTLKVDVEKIGLTQHHIQRLKKWSLCSSHPKYYTHIASILSEKKFHILYLESWYGKKKAKPNITSNASNSHPVLRIQSTNSASVFVGGNIHFLYLESLMWKILTPTTSNSSIYSSCSHIYPSTLELHQPRTQSHVVLIK